jgi:tricorn protease
VAWSPDGKSVSWFSDEGGEYQVISDQFGRTKNKIAIENPTFYYKPSWSPDSKYLSFYNENRTLWIVEVTVNSQKLPPKDLPIPNMLFMENGHQTPSGLPTPKVN